MTDQSSVELLIHSQNSNRATTELGEWITNFTQQFTGHEITYPYWDQS